MTSAPRLRYAAPLLVAWFGACAPSRVPPPAAPAPVAAPAPEPEPGVSADRHDAFPYTVPDDLLGDAPYDLPIEANGRVRQEVQFLVLERSEVIGRWIERGDRFAPFIQRVLTSYGLPGDLFHLAMIESGFVSTARSRSGAVGLWQFMPATGRGMGLRIDTLVDERMDPVRSTVAAARHLRGLYGGFGDWALAAAAYNAGAGRISRGMRGFGARDFWSLAARGDLTAETRNYVPRLYAATIIARSRQRFGFPAPAGPVSPFDFDSVEVDLATPLAELARIGTVEEADLIGLNPHLLRATTPPGRYWVWVPAGSGPRVQAAYLRSDFRSAGGIARYRLRPGEDLLTVADLAGITPERMRELNPQLVGGGVAPDVPIWMPARAAERLAARPVAASPVAAATPPVPRQPPRAIPAAWAAPRPPPAARTHTVSEGETLWGIAREYRISLDALRLENGLPVDTVRAGRVLSIP